MKLPIVLNVRTIVKSITVKDVMVMVVKGVMVVEGVMVMVVEGVMAMVWLSHVLLLLSSAYFPMCLFLRIPHSTSQHYCGKTTPSLPLPPGAAATPPS